MNIQRYFPSKIVRKVSVGLLLLGLPLILVKAVYSRQREVKIPQDRPLITDFNQSR